MKNKINILLLNLIIFAIFFPVKIFAANETWNEQTISTSTTKVISGTVTMNGTTTINAGATLTIELDSSMTSDAIIKRNFGTATAHTHMFKLNAGSKLIIKGNDTHQIILDGGNTFTLIPESDNKTITTGINYSGCAIYMIESDLELENVVIQNMFAANVSSVAPVVKVASTDETANNIIMNKTTIKNCLNRNDDATMRLEGFVKMNDCSFINCCTDAKYASIIKAGGGNIFCQLEMENCYATGNYSSGWGGVVLWAAGATVDVNGVSETAYANLSNCVFENNTARYLGGAISCEAMMTITDCTIENNTAMAGGGVATFPFTLEVEGATSDACGLVLGEGNIIKNNIATASSSFVPEITVSTSKPNGTKFPAGGGGIWCLMNREGWTCTLNVGKGNIISNNETNGTGGGIIVYKEIGGDTKLIISEAEISSNKAPMGGGVALHGAEIEISDSTISECHADENGGAVYITNGTFEMHHGLIELCKAVKGGAIYIVGGNFTLNGGTIQKNTATNSGGAIQISDGNVYITDGLISSNVARGESTVKADDVGYGGGIFVDGGETVRITGGEISNNVAAKNGGGIEVKTDKVVTVDVDSGIFQNNVADECGGAIGVECNNGTINIGRLNCDGSDLSTHVHPVLTDNIAGIQGGGFYMSGTNAILNIYCSLVDDNKVGEIENNFDQTAGTVTVYNGGQIGTQNEGIIVVGGTFIDKRTANEEKFEVIYYSNYNGSTNSKSAVITKGSLITLPSDIFGIEEYEILGWTDDINNTTTVEYETGQTLEITSNITLYALWVFEEENEPSYFVVIPAEIILNENNTTETFNVETTLNLFPRNKVLNIKIANDDFTLELLSDGEIVESLEYILEKDGEEILPGRNVVSYYSDSALITYNSVEELEIILLDEVTSYAGNYTGNLTFFVSIDDV